MSRAPDVLLREALRRLARCLREGDLVARIGVHDTQAMAGDVALLMELIPAINRKFGLTPEQIDRLDTTRRVMVYAMLKKVGAGLVGREVSKRLVLAALNKVSLRLATKQVLKYLPVAGQAAAVALSVTAMIYLGNSHVDACYEVAKGAIRK